MWRTILLIQRYSTVARTVGIPNPNRPLLSGAGYKRNCACWQIASFYFCLRSTAHNPALKISTVSIRVLQGPYDDVLSNVGVCNIHRLTTSAVAYRNIHRLCVVSSGLYEYGYCCGTRGCVPGVHSISVRYRMAVCNEFI